MFDILPSFFMMNGLSVRSVYNQVKYSVKEKYLTFFIKLL